MRQTRFILVGGYLSHAGDGGASFYRELIAPYGKGVKVLVCAFARDAEAWPSILAHEQNQLEHHTPEMSAQVMLATATNFKNQVESTDVLIFRGGDTDRLLKALEGDGDWHRDLGQKTLAGSSAGAYVLASKYVKLGRTPEVRNGLGLVDVLAVAHYRSGTFPQESAFSSHDAYWDEVDRLINQTKCMNVLRLSEGEYAIIEASKT